MPQLFKLESDCLSLGTTSFTLYHLVRMRVKSQEHHIAEAVSSRCVMERSGLEKTASTASAACRKWRSNQDLAENFGKVQQKKIIIVIFFLFYYFEIGRLAFQSGTNSRRTTFSGGVGVHILKFIWQKILPEKKPACRQFEVFSSPVPSCPGQSYRDQTLRHILPGYPICE